jgi:hypothetical protein
MSFEAFACSRCRARIEESDLESGAAIRLMGKSFCPGCKGEAAKTISLDDLKKRAAPAAAKPAQTAAPRSAPPPPPAPEKPRAPEPTEARARRRFTPPAASGSRKGLPLPLLGGIGAALAAAVLVAILLGTGKEPRTPTSNPPPSKPPAAEPTAVSASPEERAREAFKQLETLAQRGDLPPGDVLVRIEALLPAIKGSAHERAAAELRDRVQREADLARASGDLDPLVAELKKAVAADQDLKDYPKVLPLFEKARDQAARTIAVRLPEIQKLMVDYNARYEKAAEAPYAEIREGATVLADERRYPDALRLIETFPAHLRHTAAWKGLAQLKADIEKRAKSLPPKK